MSETAQNDLIPRPPDNPKIQIESVVKRIDALDSLVQLAKAQGQSVERLERIVTKYKRIKRVLEKIR